MQDILKYNRGFVLQKMLREIYNFHRGSFEVGIAQFLHILNFRDHRRS